MKRTSLDMGMDSLLTDTSDLHDATLISVEYGPNHLHLRIEDPYMRATQQYRRSIVSISLTKADDCIVPEIPYLPQPIYVARLVGNECDQFELLTEDGWEISLKVKPEESWVEIHE